MNNYIRIYQSFFKTFSLMVLLLILTSIHAWSVEVGQIAPDFSAKNHLNEDFKLSSRKGLGWTVLYFYPKAETPGCTQQACAFRDHLNEILKLNTHVYGISTDSVKDQAKFHSKEKLNFPLIADPDSKIAKLYDAKMPIIGLAKRWTFIIDQELIVRHIDKDVDPVMNAKSVAKIIKDLQNK